MTDEDLLPILKKQMLLTKAKARGAKEAYLNEVKSHVIDQLNEIGIHEGGKVSILFEKGWRNVFLEEIKPTYYMGDHIVITGYEILNAGRKSKKRFTFLGTRNFSQYMAKASK